MGYYLFNFTKKNAERGRPLTEQAANLLEVGLWGIGESTPLRGRLAVGDHVVAYVGAPERALVGWGRLSQGVHSWSGDERSRYPGTWTAGVTFEMSRAFRHPVAIDAVLARLAIGQTNPGARFFSGVIRITQGDFATILEEAEEELPPQENGGERPRSGPEREGPGIEMLFRATERLKQVLRDGGTFTEQDTRALFIDKYIDALGYTEIGDVQRGSPNESGNYPDYVLRVNGESKIGIEAKKLNHRFTPQDAAQTTRDCSVSGVRWATLTDGRYFKVYETMIPNTAPEERLVFQVDLADYDDREDFEARIYPQLALLAKAELESGSGLARRASMEAIRQELQEPGSSASAALRESLSSRRGLTLSDAELSELLADLLG